MSNLKNMCGISISSYILYFHKKKLDLQSALNGRFFVPGFLFRTLCLN